LKKLGIRPGDSVASVLPDGPDALTAAMTAKLAHANFAPLAPLSSPAQYQLSLLETNSKLLLTHTGAHPAREAARSLGIPVANVLRHFEAGVFTLESDLSLPRTVHSPPGWKNSTPGVSLVLIAPALAYRRLANRLDANNLVIGITPPSLEYLPQPRTIEHIAAECVRILRRCRPIGPYAIAGWRTESLVALEIARLLEEQGEKVAFVAMLDASELFLPQMSPMRRVFFAATSLLRRKVAPPCEFMAEALRNYHPQPWYGKILHIRPTPESRELSGNRRLEWRQIAPHGIASYEVASEMLAEPNVQALAKILAAELEPANEAVPKK
jgi:hypothetical protein